MGDVDYDQKGQYEQIRPWVLENERLYAVYDCKGAGTGFVGITDKRIIFYDKAFMRKRKALVSVPYSKITAVSSVDEGRGLWGATSELVVKTGSEEFEFEFRGGASGNVTGRPRKGGWAVKRLADVLLRMADWVVDSVGSRMANRMAVGHSPWIHPSASQSGVPRLRS